ncbi:XRE family transcriptional regulator [Saccharopolyspora flava]|uniref:XRE family transcriptional regulator n=1 Tax=Saccharopolyspora flava TaxID=95161 RepID=A0A1I6SEC0_9PSEU|nr:XRE family transcriptional regulator [Saccharopolyspora flava]SFS75264.1 hypothetical protein SAMN05660874_03148 [Saccharopolyspora flava]
MHGRNDRLREAREGTPSPRVPGSGLSRQELADAVNAWLAEHTGRAGALDGHYVARLERGAVRRPGRDYRAALRSVLGGSDVDLGFADPPNASAIDPEGVMTRAETDRLIGITTNPARVDDAGLDAVAGVLASVRRLEDETSAADVLPSVRAQTDLAERMARCARAGLRRRAVGLLSELHQYQGWLSIPMQRWDASRTHLDRAAVLALEADDAHRLATALSFQAYRAMRQDDLTAASALSEAASRDDRVGGGLSIYLRFQRAEILARSGERSEAARALSRADGLIDQLPPQEELPSSGYWYTAAFFLGQRAFVLDALGDRAAAREAARACLAEMPVEWANSEWAVRRRTLAEA